MKEITGELTAKGIRLAVVVSRFNSSVTERLLQGARDTFLRSGGDEESLTVVRVPGSFEIPMAALRLAQSGNFDAVVCLGCLIRGETPHFDYLSAEVTRGIGEVALRTGLPVVYGVLTTDTVEQAINRSGMKSGNKGSDAALAAIEMANLFRKLESH
ncbi:MAG: 6,7-dimethyl-8-ribityllumazine synthase [Acidobacteriota bacterium]